MTITYGPDILGFLIATLAATVLLGNLLLAGRKR